MLEHYRVTFLFAALADETRCGIVERLAAGPATVSELAKPYAMSLSAVMQHLQSLEACSLVRSRKSGRVRICELNPDALSAVETWVGQQRTVWEARLDRLGDYLAEEATERKH